MGRGKEGKTPDAVTPHRFQRGQPGIQSSVPQRTWRWLTYMCQAPCCRLRAWCPLRALGALSGRPPLGERSCADRTQTFVLSQGCPELLPGPPFGEDPDQVSPSSSSIQRNPRSQGPVMCPLPQKHLPVAEPYTATPGELGSLSLLFLPTHPDGKVHPLSALEMARWRET